MVGGIGALVAILMLSPVVYAPPPKYQDGAGAQDLGHSLSTGQEKSTTPKPTAVPEAFGLMAWLNSLNTTNYILSAGSSGPTVKPASLTVSSTSSPPPSKTSGEPSEISSQPSSGPTSTIKPPSQGNQGLGFQSQAAPQQNTIVTTQYPTQSPVTTQSYSTLPPVTPQTTVTAQPKTPPSTVTTQPTVTVESTTSQPTVTTESTTPQPTVTTPQATVTTQPNTQEPSVIIQPNTPQPTVTAQPQMPAQPYTAQPKVVVTPPQQPVQSYIPQPAQQYMQQSQIPVQPHMPVQNIPQHGPEQQQYAFFPTNVQYGQYPQSPYWNQPMDQSYQQYQFSPYYPQPTADPMYYYMKDQVANMHMPKPNSGFQQPAQAQGQGSTSKDVFPNPDKLAVVSLLPNGGCRTEKSTGACIHYRSCGATGRSPIGLCEPNSSLICCPVS